MSLKQTPPATTDINELAQFFSYKPRQVKSLWSVFQQYATGKPGSDGSASMTQQDFVRCLSPTEDYQKKYQHELATLFLVAASRLPVNAEDTQELRLSFADFVAFHNVMTKPNAEYEVAFRLYNPERRADVFLPQFKHIFKHTPCNSHVSLQSDVIKPYFQAHGDEEKQSLSYAEFSQLLSRMPHERIRQNFDRYDTAHTGSITLAQLSTMITDLASNRVSDVLATKLDRVADLSQQRVSYPTTQALFNVILNADLVQAVVETATSFDNKKPVTKADLLKAEKSLLKRSFFTPLELDVLFSLATKEKDGAVICGDQVRCLWKRVGKFHDTQHDDEVGWGMAIFKKMYAFGLGSIAGAIGATVVYPIGPFLFTFASTRI
jgi:solute carrier family 25 aspartate/glutamate transporter 12/13